MHPLTIERTYNALISKIWQALTDKDQMRHWYFDLKEFQPEPGFEFEFAGQGRKGEKYVHLCKIIEAIPQKKLSHTWNYEGLPGSSVVTWELFAEGDMTRVKLTHNGLESFEANGPDFAVSSFEEGWMMIVGKNLRGFVEE